jgi:hypothetical protein
MVADNQVAQVAVAHIQAHMVQVAIMQVDKVVVQEHQVKAQMVELVVETTHSQEREEEEKVNQVVMVDTKRMDLVMTLMDTQVAQVEMDNHGQ